MSDTTDDTQTIVEQGVKYPNGTYDWNVMYNYGDLSVPATQQAFQEAYSSQLAALGVEAGQVEFVRRTKTTTFSNVEELPTQEVATAPADTTPASDTAPADDTTSDKK
jgi:hypothetical protein